MDKVNEFNDIFGLTITLDDGTDVDFKEVASINIDDDTYLIMQPDNNSSDITLDEAIVVKVILNDDTNDYEICQDEAVLNKVFDEYEKLFTIDDE